MKPSLSIARDLAVSALKDRQGNVSAHLDRLLKEASLSRADKALARELALGTVRRRATLEHVLQAFLAHPDRRLPSPVREILHAAIYQLLFLDRVPDFAVVNEAVTQAARFSHKRQGGFINGVLRTIARNVSEAIAGAPPLAADVVPVGPGTYRKLTHAAFPDPQDEPADYLASAFSLPQFLARRWLDRSGSLAEAVAIAMHANVRAPVVLRVNALKTNLQGASEALAADGAETAPHDNGVSLVLPGHTDITQLEAFRDGLVQPQDATATSVSLAADPKPGMKVLDFCAGPGTKTTHLAEMMDNRGSILALDVSSIKLHRIESNCLRMGVTIVQTALADQAGGLELKSFDLVLADVPCTNTGVLSRRPEARWRFDERGLKKLTDDQAFLAAAAGRFVKPGGRMVYSTCSIEPEECDHVVRRLAKTAPDLRLVKEELTLPCGAENPTCWRDGGYCAVLEAKT